MKDVEIKLLQSAQLLIMDEIHRVCVINHLRYYMIGGTAIGAVRHKGMIPWDSDIDVAMPREDYEKFIRIFNKECNEKYSLHYFKTDKNFVSAHVVIYMNNSNIVFRNARNESSLQIRNHIYVDVLPLDRCPNDRCKMEKQKKDLLRIKKIKKYKYIPIYSENSILKRLTKNLIHLCLKPFSLTTIYRLQHHIMQRYNTIPNSTHWCSMASHYTYDRLRMPKEYFGTPKLIEFDGREYYGPEMIEQYLEHLFGDYMKMPDIEKQTIQKDSILSADWIDVNGDTIHVGI